MNIGIIGLGLIGGSIGLKLQTLNHSVYGVANNESNAKKAKDRKLANYISCDLSILRNCSLVILALPIKDLINPTQELIDAIPSNAVLTDVGSIKKPIVKVWETIHPLFVGSHPMAGTEKNGTEAGYTELFDGAKWIITPTSKTSIYAIEKLSKLISTMDCKIYRANPTEHDQAVALISHLPIFLSSCLIQTANDNKNNSFLKLAKEIAARGFADTSRVGAGNPELGLDLAKYNKDNILDNLKLFKEYVDDFENIVSNNNWVLLNEILQNSRQVRPDFLSD